MKLTLQLPDDWHLHLRDGDMLGETVPASARCFKRAIIMPNLAPPVRTAEEALAYKARILAANNTGNPFDPQMTLYLTDNTTADDIRAAAKADVRAVKLYPAGATTNSSAGVTNLEALSPVLEALIEVNMPLLVHGEVTTHDIDIFDREKVFINERLGPLLSRFPQLRVVMEHITTKDAVDFVLASNSNLAATITPQHLLLNRNDLLVGGIRPHNYCLPVLKRNTHQQALREAVASGDKRFFLGTDSAPHEQANKETACGCAGCYSAWAAIELYAQVFEELGALDKLEAFASHNGPDYYGLPRNTGSLTLEKSPWQIPDAITLPNGRPIIPFMAGTTINWKVTSVDFGS